MTGYIMYSTGAHPPADQRSKLCLTWVRPVCARRVVENEYGGKVGADGGQVLGVRSKVQRAVLSVVPAQDGKFEVLGIIYTIYS